MSKLDNRVEELADYLYVNTGDDYEAVKEFGRLRFEQGKIYALRQINNTLNDTGVARYVADEEIAIRKAIK